MKHDNLFEPWGTSEEHSKPVALDELCYWLSVLRVGCGSWRRLFLRQRVKGAAPGGLLDGTLDAAGACEL